MPPICRPVPDDPTTVADIHAVMVDGLARHRLADAGWRPDLPTARAPATVAARAVFRALGSPDPLISGSAIAHPDEVHELATRFERHHRRRARRTRGRPPGPARRARGRRTTTGRSASRSSTSSTRGGGARPRTSGTPRRWPSSWPASESRVGVLADVVGELALALAGSVEVAAELATTHEPSSLELGVEDAGRFLEQAPAELDRLGIDLIGPERLVRAGVSVRGRAAPSPPSDHPGAVRARGRRAVEDGRRRRRRADGAVRRPSWPGPSRRGPRCCTPAGAGCASTPPRCAGPGGAWRSTSATTSGSTPSRCCAWPVTARSRPIPRAAPAPAGRPTCWAGCPTSGWSRSTSRTGSAASCGPYQRRGLSWLRFLQRLGLGGCLADDMGLGKTATTLAHLMDRPGPHLVVCPLSVVHNWEAEAARFAPGDARRRAPRGRAGRRRRAPTATSATCWKGPSPSRSSPSGCWPSADLVITTYGLLPRDLEHLGAVAWSTVVADEAQLIKNPGTRAAKAFRVLRAGQKLALTGTPVENRLADLWAILDAVNPGMLGSRERFRHRFGKPIERDGDGDAAARLRRITQPFVLRRTKADRTLVPGPAGQDRAGRLGRPDARAGGAVPARRRPAARRRRRHDRHEAPRARARRADPAQADLQPPGPRARRRLAAGRSLGQAGALRRARRRAARRRRAGARVHAVPGDGRAAAPPRRRAAGPAGAVPPRRRVAGPAATRWWRTSRPASARRCC